MADQRPEPLVPADVDLRSFDDMPVDVSRLRSSDMQVEVTPEQGWYGFQLWCASWHQVPASSLPNDDAKLAFLAGLGRDLRTWKRMRSGALRGFVECSDGRLYHPVVAEKALKAWELKKSRVRGAETTNQRAKNSQGIDNTQNTSRSADRSIYNVDGGQRPDGGSPSDNAETRPATGTEQSRAEQNNIPLTPKGEVGTDQAIEEAFDRFWKAYPSRGPHGNPKKPAKQKFLAACRRGADPEAIIAGAKAYAAVPSLKVGTEFVKQATTWLNQECWKDFDAKPAKANGAPASHRWPDDDQKIAARIYLAVGTRREDGEIGAPYRPIPKHHRKWMFPDPPPGHSLCPVSPEVFAETAKEVGAEWPE